MSRLDSVIRRLTAQRDCLGLAAELIAQTQGHVLELGLGNGRTFDHLRSILPRREIFCFDRQVAAHPDCIPDDAHLFLGELEATLPQAVARLGAGAALVHVDIGSGDDWESLPQPIVDEIEAYWGLSYLCSPLYASGNDSFMQEVTVHYSDCDVQTYVITWVHTVEPGVQEIQTHDYDASFDLFDGSCEL